MSYPKPDRPDNGSPARTTWPEAFESGFFFLVCMAIPLIILLIVFAFFFWWNFPGRVPIWPHMLRTLVCFFFAFFAISTLTRLRNAGAFELEGAMRELTGESAFDRYEKHMLHYFLVGLVCLIFLASTFYRLDGVHREPYDAVLGGARNAAITYYGEGAFPRQEKVIVYCDRWSYKKNGTTNKDYLSGLWLTLDGSWVPSSSQAPITAVLLWVDETVVGEYVPEGGGSRLRDAVQIHINMVAYDSVSGLHKRFTFSGPTPKATLRSDEYNPSVRDLVREKIESWPLASERLNAGKLEKDPSSPDTSGDIPEEPVSPPPPESDDSPRLLAQKSALLDQVAQGKSFTATITQETVSQAMITVVEATEDGSIVMVEFENPEDESERRRYAGKLGNAPVSPGEATPKRWEITLLGAGSGVYPFDAANKALLLYVDASSNMLRGSNGIAKLSFQAVESPISTPSRRRKVLMARSKSIRPGAVYKGVIKNYDSEPISLTFTAVRNGGQYVRAFAQLENDEWAVAVYEGALPTANETRMKLKRIFTAGSHVLSNKHAGELLLSFLDNGELANDAGGLHILLSPSKVVDPPPVMIDQLLAAMTSGRRWEGRYDDRMSPPENVILTFVETRNQGDYLRATLTFDSRPHLITVLEGALDSRESQIEGYPVLLLNQPTVIGPKFLQTAPFQTRIRRVYLRISYDGQILYAYTSDGSRLKLTPLADKLPLPDLSRPAVARAIREVVVENTNWEGVLSNLAAAKSIPVELKFVAVSDDGAEVRAIVSSKKVGNRKGKIRYQGSLRLDDQHINEYPLALKKVGGGVPPLKSTTFGATDSTLYLRLSSDKKRLTGWTNYEVFELFQVKKQKRAAEE